MEDHLPEFEYILMVNANAEEVPAINFNGACCELELIKAANLQSIQKACNVNQPFSKYVTRINKVCIGTAKCASVPVDKDLFVDLEDFAKAFRKEVPPRVRINIKSCLGPHWCKTDTAKADLRCFVQEFR